MRNLASLPIRDISAFIRCKRHIKKQRQTYRYGATHSGAVIVRETNRKRERWRERDRESYIDTASRLHPPHHNCRSRQCRVACVVLVSVFVELLQASATPHRTHALHCEPKRSCPELRSNLEGLRKHISDGVITPCVCGRLCLKLPFSSAADEGAARYTASGCSIWQQKLSLRGRLHACA